MKLDSSKRSAAHLRERLALRHENTHYRMTCVNELLSSGAFAELAAAQQCKLIAAEFKQRGLFEYADTYERIELEERTHFRLLEQCCNPMVNPRPQASEVYLGRKLSSQNFLLERLVVVHLVFEPAALAFLGAIGEFVSEPGFGEWGKTVIKHVGIILDDEREHIADSSLIIGRLMTKTTAEERRTLRRAVRVHSAFLSLGIKSIFDVEDPRLSECLKGMIVEFRKKTITLQKEVGLL